MQEHRNPDHPAIIFDFGGVLLEWDPRLLYRKFFDGDQQAMENFLEEVQFFEWNHQQDAGRPFAEAIEDLCSQYPHHCDLIRAYHTHFEETVAGPIQGTVEILAALKDRGYTLFALSNWACETFLRIRDGYPFLGWFESTVISGDVGLAKPDPRIFQVLLDRIQRPADSCLFIDDSAANIAVARQLGFQIIHFQSPAQLKAELEQLQIL